MLNPKELMLGNWVYESERSQFPMQVVNIDKDMVYLDFDYNHGAVFEGWMKYICPIPLTEEILLKNGFKYDGIAKQFFSPHGFYYSLYIRRFGEDLYWVQGYEQIFEKPIKYVHQLQNILTIAGIEIDFKI